MEIESPIFLPAAGFVNVRSAKRIFAGPSAPQALENPPQPVLGHA